ncbi:MAG: phytoene/squalene synthase family protein [Pseudomonadota bacterium]
MSSSLTSAVRESTIDSADMSTSAPGLMSGSIEVTSADHAACRAILQQGSKSFHLASTLLPRRVREPAAALYAFCRLADDAVDLEGGKGDTLADLTERLDRVYGGCPGDDAVERALSATVRDYAIPRAVLDGLIDGLAWDADGRAYETLSELRAYAARVASTVGVASTLLMGVRSNTALARAADLGVAMQLTNIARDVGEDARAGRLYLPKAWMREAGLDPEAWLAAPRFDARLAEVIERMLAEADRLYLRALHGIALLPRDCRLGIHAARLIYREIGEALRRAGHDSVSHRTVVPFRRKLALVLRAALTSTTGGKEPVGAPPLDETAFLVDAVARQSMSSEGATIGTGLSKSTLSERIGWAIELLTRLEENDRMQRSANRRP